jgi:hypothetical protein|tara:strand:+ start:146 stop:256 length:111 start_codon:yes stop_codon:yes gene_type:complete
MEEKRARKYRSPSHKQISKEAAAERKKPKRKSRFSQ